MSTSISEIEIKALSYSNCGLYKDEDGCDAGDDKGNVVDGEELNDERKDIPQPSFAMRLSEEIWMHILMFVEDTDLQTLTKVSRLHHRLTSDTLLWRHIHHTRNASRISSRLFKTPNRPTQGDLVRFNILKGMPGLLRRVERGESFVWGIGGLRSYEAFKGVEWKVKVRILERGLVVRPNIGELSQRNLIPPEIATIPAQAQGSPLLSRMRDLKKAMKRDSLKQQLRSRITAQDFKELGVAKTQTVITYNPTLLSKAVELEKRLAEVRLVSKLIRRPSAGILEGMKVLRNDSMTAVLICPSIKKKVDFFEKLGKDGNSGSGDRDSMGEEDQGWLERERMVRRSRWSVGAVGRS
ncbi:hypothetical protein HDU76_004771 [Blyttiomyces sp. JEL0837]|nr:hypothetical protein HDU76_004771 [Blyttiomyces sp. JEL0837]